MAKYWIDPDTALDDAVALMLAFAHARSHIVGISTVSGNVPVDQATINARYIARLCDASVDINKGAAAPLRRPFETAQCIHGQDGMGDIGLDLGKASASNTHAANALVQSALANSGALEVVTLGPLTNIALALQLDPSIAHLIRRITIMGGTSDYYGNITPVS